jgi:phospholipid transport system substrate-binding protein
MKDGLRWLWLLAFGAGQAVAQVPSPGPLEAVRASNERVQGIIGSRERIAGPAREALHRAIEEATDFATISRRVIESFCKKLTAAECDEFDRTFRDLLRSSSLRKLGRYRADRFEYLGEDVRGDKATVRTVAFYKEESVRLDYLLERPAGRWVIVNYLVDDVDTVRNYRKQFLRLFAKNDFRGVIERLKAKIAEIESEL